MGNCYGEPNRDNLPIIYSHHSQSGQYNQANLYGQSWTCLVWAVRSGIFKSPYLVRIVVLYSLTRLIRQVSLVILATLVFLAILVSLVSVAILVSIASLIILVSLVGIVILVVLFGLVRLICALKW